MLNKKPTLPFMVSILDEDNNPIDNLDWFASIDEAIEYALKNKNKTGVFFETFNKEKNICGYELRWHPCGDCAEYPDCQKINSTVCPYSAGTHSPGVCANCGSDNIEYASIEPIDESVAYPWVCNSCKASGLECYSLVFEGHEKIERENIDE